MTMVPIRSLFIA